MRAQAHIRANAQDGFTLVETVVALAILALTLGALYESFGWSLRRTGVLNQQEAAWLIAQSMLAEIRSSEVIRTGDASGETSDGMKWNSHVAAASASSVAANGALTAFAVTIDVSWGSRSAQRVRLQSIVTGRAAT